MGWRRGLNPSTAGGAFGLGVLLGTLLGLGVCGVTVWGPPGPGGGGGSWTGRLLFPVPGGSRDQLADGFEAPRGSRRHEAVDIPAPRGTPVLAVSDGALEHVSTSRRGGRGLYLRSATGGFCFYYAHLDRYAPGLKQGQAVTRGQILGAVGSSGNAPADAPHLHLAVLRVEAQERCPQGSPVDPYPLLAQAERPALAPVASP